MKHNIPFICGYYGVLSYSNNKHASTNYVIYFAVPNSFSFLGAIQKLHYTKHISYTIKQYNKCPDLVMCRETVVSTQRRKYLAIR